MTITRRVLPLGAGDSGDLGSTRLQTVVGAGSSQGPAQRAPLQLRRRPSTQGAWGRHLGPTHWLLPGPPLRQPISAQLAQASGSIPRPRPQPKEDGGGRGAFVNPQPSR